MVKESDGGGKITLPGRVAFDEDRTQRVASPIDGRAVGILVKLGDKVRGGQPLVQLSSAHVGEIQADAQKALSDLGVAEKGIERIHKLQSIGAVADKEVAQSEGDFKKAKSDYARAAAQLKALGISASDPAVNVALRAQIPGVVVERNVLVGQEVRSDGADAAADHQQPGHRLGASPTPTSRIWAWSPRGPRSPSAFPPTRARPSPVGSSTSARWSTPTPAPSRSAAWSTTPATA